MAWGAIAAAAAPYVVNSLFGKKAKGPDYGPALAAINAVGVPAIEDLKIQLQELVSAGEISPIQADAILQEATAYEDIEGDPLTRQAQMQALSQLQDVGTGEGLDEIAQGRLAQAQQEFRTTERGAREAALQRAQERGLGGSEVSLAAQLQSGQDAAQTGAMQAQQAAADQNMRALEAIYQSGQLGGQIRGMDFDQAARIAQAQDEINRFNVMSRQNMQGENIARREAADYANLAERQRLMDYNTTLRNTQEQYNKNLRQQQFENEMQKANAMASLYGAQAQGQAQATAQNQQMMGNLIGLGGQLGSAYLQYGGGNKTPTTQMTQKPTQNYMTTQVMPQTNYGPRLPQTKLDMGWDPYKNNKYAMAFNQPG